MRMLKFRVSWVSISQLIAYINLCMKSAINSDIHFGEYLNMRRITLFTTRELHDVSQKTMNQLQHL